MEFYSGIVSNDGFFLKPQLAVVGVGVCVLRTKWGFFQINFLGFEART